MQLVRDIRDIADHWASGDCPRLSYAELAPPGRSAIRPPAFLLGETTAGLLVELFGQVDTPRVGCYGLENALVAPTGIAIKDGIAFHADTFLHPRHHVVEVSDRLNSETLPVRRVAGPLAVMYGPAHETWGHWLVDFLPRLWVLHSTGHALSSLRFLVPPDVGDFALTLLRLCGLRNEQLLAYDYWAELLLADLLLMPTGLRAGSRLAPCFAEATTFWLRLARRDRATAGPERVFLSRSQAPQARQLLNRQDVEGAATAAGYQLVSPETLTVAEQIELFSGARLLAGEYGSALHNSIFAGPGACVCGLRGTSRHPSFIQTGIASALGQNAGYVFAATDGQDVAQSMCIDIDLFSLALALMELQG